MMVLTKTVLDTIGITKYYYLAFSQYTLNNSTKMKAFKRALFKIYFQGRPGVYFPSIFLGMFFYSMAITTFHSWTPNVTNNENIVCPEMLLVSIAASKQDICTLDLVELKAQVSGGERPYSYEWYDNISLTGDPIGTDSILLVRPSETTNYAVKVTSICDEAIDESIADVIINVEENGPTLKLTNLSCDTAGVATFGFSVRGIGDQLELIGAGKDRIITFTETNIMNFEIRGIPSGDTVKVIASKNDAECTVELEITKVCEECPPELRNVSVEASNDTIVCRGVPIMLSARASGGVQGYFYEWFDLSTSPKSSVGTGPQILVTPNATKEYEVSVSSQCGGALDTVKVETLDSPELDSIKTVCNVVSGEYCFRFTSSTANFAITPNNFSATQINGDTFEICEIPKGTAITISAFNLDSNCTSTLTIMEACDCTPIEVEIVGDSVLCENDSTILQARIISGGANPSFLWSFDPNFTTDLLGTTSQIVAKPTRDTTFYLRVINENKCDTAFNDFFIDMNSEPALEKDSLACQVEDSLYQIFFTTEGDVITTSAGILRRISPLFYVINNVPIDQTVVITSRFQENDCEVSLTCPPPATFDPCFCRSGEIEVVINEEDPTICKGDSVALSATVMGTDPPFDINWFADNSFSTPIGNGDNILFSPDSSGYYYVVATEAEACDRVATDSIFITVDPRPELTLDSTVCEDIVNNTYAIFFTSNTDQLTVSTGNLENIDGDSYSVNGIPLGTTVQVIGVISESICPQDTLVATFTEEDCDPCLRSDLSFTNEGDTSLCVDNQDTLLEHVLSANIQGGVSPISVTWYDNPELTGSPIDSMFDILVQSISDTTFYARAIDSLGCEKTDAITINRSLKDSIIYIFECAEDRLSYTAKVLTNADGITSDLGEVTFDGENFVIANIPSGEVVTINSTNASTDCTTMITVDPKLECCFPEMECENIIAPNRDCILRGDTTQLRISNDFDCLDCIYQWSPEGSLNDPSAKEPIASPQSTTRYTVDVFDANECFVCRDTITIPVLECGPENIFFPDLFTPNGDGVNDILSISVINVERVKVLLVNRFGQVLKEEEWTNLGGISGQRDSEGNKGIVLELWDGTLNGRDVPPDVYGYFLEVTCNFENQEYVLQGNVSLLR